eukprot:TRINITY_DN1774_c0_g1_i2.p1 TRINITY_DN1774_c0_g1~~TRINITY_DN1774_c0_g1_i2.p1  ORF type:complete len:691 (+),score=185.27 TRINITY_DN1774_c0_g1_i2:453-2525(+)
MTELLNLQDEVLKLQRSVFSTPLNECRESSLIPLIVEAWAIYSIVVHHLKKFSEVTDHMDVLGSVTERFYTQYITLRAFLEACNSRKYITNTIAVPLLPKDAPVFVTTTKPLNVQRVNLEAKQNAPQAVPIPISAVKRQLNVVEMEQQIADSTQTRSAIAVPVAVSNASGPQQYTVGNSAIPVNQPRFLSLKSQAATAYDPFNVSSAGQRQVPPPEWVKFSSPLPTAQGPAQPSPAPVVKAVDDSAVKLAGTIKELEAEREKNKALEAQLQQQEQQINKWKDAYGDLLNAQEQERKKATADEINQALGSLENSLIALDSPTQLGNENASPDDVLENGESLASELDKLLAAFDSDSQVDLARAIRATGTKNAELVDNVKGASRLTDDPSLKQALFDATRLCADSTSKLMGAVRDSAPKEEVHARAQQAKSNVDQVMKATGSLLKEEEKAPGAEEDLSALAANELNKAAKVIEEAVNQLAELLKKRTAKPTPQTEETQIGDAILNATMAISAAVARLVKNATVSQNELVEKGKASSNENAYNKNRTWSEGLISAAKSAAEATAELVRQANAAANGNAQEEGLVAASKAVSAATTQLVVASRVRADPSSSSQRDLEDAAGAVSGATKALVAAAKALRTQETEVDTKDTAYTAGGMTGIKIKEMEQNMRILRLEKELEAERVRLARMRQAQYAK